ncbi:MAG: hypothetical protein U0441_35165 [Polyangiaceae bacterium]
MSIKTWFTGKKAEAEPVQAAAPENGAGEPAAPPGPPPIDFVAILESSGINAEVRDRVTKAKQLLKSMPAGTPAETKRQIVEAAFAAFDIPTQKIVEGATQEIAAFRGFIQAGEGEKEARLAEGERRIADLERAIRETRAYMESVVQAQDRRLRLTTEQIDSIQPVLQFFQDKSAAAAPPAPAPKVAEPGPESLPDVHIHVAEEAVDSQLKPYL